MQIRQKRSRPFLGTTASPAVWVEACGIRRSRRSPTYRDGFRNSSGTTLERRRGYLRRKVSPLGRRIGAVLRMRHQTAGCSSEYSQRCQAGMRTQDRIARKERTLACDTCDQRVSAWGRVAVQLGTRSILGSGIWLVWVQFILIEWLCQRHAFPQPGFLCCYQKEIHDSGTTVTKPSRGIRFHHT
jgi:hypothetical protein